MTFSIIGLDFEAEMIGSAVASKWTGVGACVPFFRPGVGMVNIQNFSCAQIAYRVLDEMEKGEEPAACVEKALAPDNARDARQCALATLQGGLYAYSGPECSGTFHHLSGKDCVAAGNTLADKAVIAAMVESFESTKGQMLADRLITALEAGQARGGDARGQEAAAVKVFKFSYPVQRFYPIDLRVDHHDAPLQELRKLYAIFGENERRVVE